MSGPFAILNTAASGVSVANQWLAATSDNIANVNTVRPAGEQPYRARQVVAAPIAGGGVMVKENTVTNRAPDKVYDPASPLADADGYVTRPVVDLTEEMTNRVVAQRMFQVNLSVHSAGMEAYRAALRIGEGR